MPQAKQANIVNSLTIAYCPIAEADARVPADMKVAALDHFGERVYSELRSGRRD